MEERRKNDREVGRRIEAALDRIAENQMHLKSQLHAIANFLFKLQDPLDRAAECCEQTAKEVREVKISLSPQKEGRVQP